MSSGAIVWLLAHLVAACTRSELSGLPVRWAVRFGGYCSPTAPIPQYVPEVVETHSLYELDAAKVTYAVVERFVADAERADLLAESMTLELKVKRSGPNIAEAVAGLANSDGGIVLVGVDGAAHPRAGRVPGIPRADLDGLVEHLRGLIEILPEIIPVAIPDTERVVVVIRVDADVFPHPVVVSGRVLFRVPGATVPADRRRVTDLADRDRRALGNSAPPLVPVVHDPQRFPLWDEGDSLHLGIRVMGGLRLPERVARRPWLTTPARDGVVGALEASHLPARLWSTVRGEDARQEWRLKDRRSTWLTAVSPGQNQGPVKVNDVALSSGIVVALEGRHLSCLLGTRLDSVGGVVVPLGFEDLYHALSEHVTAVRNVYLAIADALDAADPSAPTPWRGWVQAGDGLGIPDVVDLTPYRRDSSSRNNEAVLPQMLADTSDDDLDGLVRDWLTVFMLDLGVGDFEVDLAAFARSTERPAP